jgi:hypothetical protein
MHLKAIRPVQKPPVFLCVKKPECAVPCTGSNGTRGFEGMYPKKSGFFFRRSPNLWSGLLHGWKGGIIVKNMLKIKEKQSMILYT